MPHEIVKSNCSVVIPTIRKDRIVAWIETWEKFLLGIGGVYIVIDERESFDIDAHENMHVFCWGDIDAELGDNAWIIPRRSDCVRSYGFLRAAADSHRAIITLDDDVLPLGDDDPIQKHIDALNSIGKESLSAWTPSVSHVRPRGLPYDNLHRHVPIYMNHGLWHGIPDLDSLNQICVENENECRKKTPHPVNRVVPRGMYMPCCGMNLSWRIELTPALYFWLMGQRQDLDSAFPFDRFGDIWSGIVAKRIMDHLGYGLMNGDPVVLHDRASNKWANLRKEANGLEANELLWSAIDRVALTGDNVKDCVIELWNKIDVENLPHADYWKRMANASRTWASLFTTNA